VTVHDRGAPVTVEQEAEEVVALARSAGGPRSERVVPPGGDHGGDLRKPAEVARVVRDLTGRLFTG
jgi:hypothetical protein